MSSGGDGIPSANVRAAREAYESRLAASLGVRHVVSFAYARHGLTEILSVQGIGSGDAVVLSPLTCKVVPLALLSLGIQPIYADISAATLNLDADEARAAVTPRTKAFLFQHTYGQSRGLARVARRASEGRLVLVEDCAQRMPRATPGRESAVRGSAAIFSNNLRKPMPAGSGGFVATDDDALALALRERRDVLPLRSGPSRIAHFVESFLHAHVLGPRTYWPLFELHRLVTGVYRTRAVRTEILQEVCATRFQVSEDQYAAGLRWLARLNDLLEHRRKCCERYREALTGFSEVGLPWSAGSEPLQFFPVLVRNKSVLLSKARTRSIEIVAWPGSTPIYPIEDDRLLAAYGYELGSCPVAEEVAGRLVGLPTDLSTKARHVEATIELILQASR